MIVERVATVQFRSAGGEYDTEAEAWHGAAAFAVMRLRWRQRVRFSFMDDAKQIDRAERLLRRLGEKAKGAGT